MHARRRHSISDLHAPGDYYLEPATAAATWRYLWFLQPNLNADHRWNLVHVVIGDGRHELTEHDDGTVTVLGLIRIAALRGAAPTWTGHLDHDEWRPAT